jgi:hypothetical protein
MTIALFRAAKSAEQLLLKAVVLSLAIHLAAFGGWKWGRAHISWKPLALPAWLALTPHNPSPNSLLARRLPAAQLPQPPPVLKVYVEVDPALAVAEPPANPQYYSTKNTVAANPEIKVPSEKPQISGEQDKVMKTVPSALRAVEPTPALQPPLQPAPREDKKLETAKTVPSETGTGDGKPLPKPAETVGDLADARPAPKTQPTKGTSASENGTGAAPAPAHERPRNLDQARAQKGAPGPKTRQPGGVNHLASDSSVDAVRTVYGDYDRDFIDAVQARWDALLRNRQDDVSGKVVLEFNLHSDGRITDMRKQYSDVNELLTLICQQAVLDPALYKPWPVAMLRKVPDPRPMRFTFYYSY